MDKIINGMLRGFGWGVGRRAASRIPWPIALVLVAVALWYQHGR